MLRGRSITRSGLSPLDQLKTKVTVLHKGGNVSVKVTVCGRRFRCACKRQCRISTQTLDEPKRYVLYCDAIWAKVCFFSLR